MTVSRGRQLFLNPGPTNIPDRILNAMHRPAVDFMEAEFHAVALDCQAGLKALFKTERPVFIHASNGHGAWEAAMVNVFSPGDTLLIPETGRFSASWGALARGLGLEVETIPGDWRHGADPEAIAERLNADTDRIIKAVAVVHNETSNGVASDCGAIGAAIRDTGHPALYLIDTISSLGSFDFRMDEWGVDVAVGGSQKGLMLPPGLGFTVASDKAMQASETATLPRVYWDWHAMLPVEDRGKGTSPGTSPLHMMYGLQEALAMLAEEGLDNVFTRHHHLGEATRRAVRAWSVGGGPELMSLLPHEHSDSVTAILMPAGHEANLTRQICIERFNVSLGSGLDQLKGKVFRIGHMGDLNAAMLLGGISAVEMSLSLAQVPHGKGGTQAAADYLSVLDRPI